MNLNEPDKILNFKFTQNYVKHLHINIWSSLQCRLCEIALYFEFGIWYACYWFQQCSWLLFPDCYSRRGQRISYSRLMLKDKVCMLLRGTFEVYSKK